MAHPCTSVCENAPKQLIDRFRYYREEFGKANDLVDEDIFFIRKDAICTKKYCYVTKLDDYIEFREKNVYGCYVRIEPQYNDNDTAGKPSPIEFYWKPNGDVDVKGINDDYVEYHKDGILLIISKFMNYLYSMNYDGALRYIVSVMNAYKLGYGDKQGAVHPERFYRRFDNTAKYRIWKDGAILEVDDIGENLIPICDKAYNYRNIFVPLLNLVVK